jgi:hypothetical protein
MGLSALDLDCRGCPKFHVALVQATIQALERESA